MAAGNSAVFLSDNDIVIKLVQLGLIEEFKVVYAIQDSQIHILPTLKSVVAGKTFISKHGVTTSSKILACISKFQEINNQVSASEMALLTSVQGIDVGEAVMFGASAHYSPFLIVTGDKKALKALAGEPRCTKITQRLQGKLICFEQVLLKIVERLGMDSVRKRLFLGRSCDKGLEGIMHKENISKKEFFDGLSTYLRTLRKSSGGLLS